MKIKRENICVKTQEKKERNRRDNYEKQMEMEAKMEI